MSKCNIPTYWDRIDDKYVRFQKVLLILPTLHKHMIMILSNRSNHVSLI